MTLIFMDIPPKMSMKNSPPIDYIGAEFIELLAGCIYHTL